MYLLNRIALPLINALFITTVLFYIMFSLVRMDEPELLKKISLPPLIWTQVPEDTQPDILVAKPLAPKEVEVAPELPRDTPIVDIGPIQGPSLVPDFDRSTSIDILSPNDSQLVLALGYPPNYPSSAISRGIEGYAVVGFSVGTSGAVFDPFIIESEPKGVFDRSSLKAILKFKYKARMVGGKPVSTDGQRYMFTYKLNS